MFLSNFQYPNKKSSLKETFQIINQNNQKLINSKITQSTYFPQVFLVTFGSTQKKILRNSIHYDNSNNNNNLFLSSSLLSCGNNFGQKINDKDRNLDLYLKEKTCGNNCSIRNNNWNNNSIKNSLQFTKDFKKISSYQILQHPQCPMCHCQLRQKSIKDYDKNKHRRFNSLLINNSIQIFSRVSSEKLSNKNSNSSKKSSGGGIKLTVANVNHRKKNKQIIINDSLNDSASQRKKIFNIQGLNQKEQKYNRGFQINFQGTFNPSYENQTHQYQPTKIREQLLKKRIYPINIYTSQKYQNTKKEKHKRTYTSPKKQKEKRITLSNNLKNSIVFDKQYNLDNNHHNFKKSFSLSYHPLRVSFNQGKSFDLSLRNNQSFVEKRLLSNSAYIQLQPKEYLNQQYYHESFSKVPTTPKILRQKYLKNRVDLFQKNPNKSFKNINNIYCQKRISKVKIQDEGQVLKFSAKKRKSSFVQINKSRRSKSKQKSQKSPQSIQRKEKPISKLPLQIPSFKLYKSNRSQIKSKKEIKQYKNLIGQKIKIKQHFNSQKVDLQQNQKKYKTHNQDSILKQSFVSGISSENYNNSQIKALSKTSFPPKCQENKFLKSKKSKQNKYQFIKTTSRSKIGLQRVLKELSARNIQNKQNIDFQKKFQVPCSKFKQRWSENANGCTQQVEQLDQSLPQKDRQEQRKISIQIEEKQNIYIDRQNLNFLQPISFSSSFYKKSQNKISQILKQQTKNNHQHVIHNKPTIQSINFSQEQNSYINTYSAVQFVASQYQNKSQLKFHLNQHLNSNLYQNKIVLRNQQASTTLTKILEMNGNYSQSDVSDNTNKTFEQM